MQLYGFLALLDGTVKLSCAQLLCGCVANHVVGQGFQIVVFVAVALLGVAFEIGLMAVEVGVVPGFECLYTTGQARVLLCGTRAYCRKAHDVYQNSELFHLVYITSEHPFLFHNSIPFRLQI